MTRQWMPRSTWKNWARAKDDARALTVGCPSCGAPSSEPCRETEGIHKARRLKADPKQEFARP